MRAKIMASVFACILLSTTEGQCFDFQSLREFSQCATQAEHQGKWTQIHWLKDMAQAKARAKAENKPILVFLVVGFRGEKNAAEC